MRPKKRFGQHFLSDGGAARRIAALAATEAGARVVEIGAGTGTLTRALLERDVRLVALEIDRDLVALLRERRDLGGAEIVEADALAFDFEAVSRGEPWVAAGNLPYNIATPLLVSWFGGTHPPARIVAMVQRDVADRLVARPSTAAYGSLTILASYYTDVHRAFVLGPAAFYPRPKVDSAVVVLERRARPAVDVREPAFFLQVVRAGFAYRRKTLANSLALALDIERKRTQAVLRQLELDSEIRAEQLDLGAFGALADNLAP